MKSALTHLPLPHQSTMAVQAVGVEDLEGISG